MFGDMQLAPAVLLERSPYFTEMKKIKPENFVLPSDAQVRVCCCLLFGTPFWALLDTFWNPFLDTSRTRVGVIS